MTKPCDCDICQMPDAPPEYWRCFACGYEGPPRRDTETIVEWCPECGVSTAEIGVTFAEAIQ